jgi:Zn-finger nucleic acid-binding protein
MDVLCTAALNKLYQAVTLEFDKIIERSSPSANVKTTQQDRFSDSQRHSSDTEYRPKKKKSMFDDLFDF